MKGWSWYHHLTTADGFILEEEKTYPQCPPSILRPLRLRLNAFQDIQSSVPFDDRPIVREYELIKREMINEELRIGIAYYREKNVNGALKRTRSCA